MIAMQHGFGLLLLDTGTTQRKGEFVTATHGQDRVKQASGWNNVDGGDTKLRPQGLFDRLSDDLRMTYGVRAVLVYPQVKGGVIHGPHPPRPRHAEPLPLLIYQKKASRGSRAGTRSNERRN